MHEGKSHIRIAVLWLIGLGLALGTVDAYIRLGSNDFIDLDDEFYVTDNPHVKGGLTPVNLKWAWSTFDYGFYQPITWMSLQLDAWLCSRCRFGEKNQLNAAGFHFHNLFLHIATTLMLFCMLQILTGATGCSALIAALFALHPMHVESVAWATERKDVLSTFFWVVTIGAYCLWARTGARLLYAAALLSLALGLLAKPMLVTLPCTLLLLDFWPLRRFRNGNLAAQVFWLFVEKLPFFALAAAATWLTLIANLSMTAIVPIQKLSLGDRIANAITAYGWYIEKTFWPVNLCVFYPHAFTDWTWPPLIAGAAALLAGTLVSLICCRRVPALAVGWFWFIGTLVPVLGLVQVGSQSWADRFVYVPHIGLFIGLVWAAAALLYRLRVPATVQLISAIGLLCLLAMATFFQVDHWRDTGTIWQHALESTVNNDRAHANIGRHFRMQGSYDQARRHYEAALRIRPKNALYMYNLGIVLMFQGENKKAAEIFSEAWKLDKATDDAAHNLGDQALRARVDELLRAISSKRHIARPGTP
jgi:hypothetical protein